LRDRIKVISEEVLAKNWGVLKKWTFDFLRRDGGWQRQVREIYDHGSAAAILLFCPEKQTVILVRQFRLPVYLDGRDGWLLEVCAGLLDGDTPEVCVRREAEEEAGIRVKAVRHVVDADMSPGSLTEKVSCFVGSYDAEARISAGGGLVAEGEDIEVIELDFAKALALIGEGQITDAKTVLLLQHLALNPWPPGV
jgi:GDP-mannose pyrophosphatase NudK